MEYENDCLSNKGAPYTFTILHTIAKKYHSPLAIGYVDFSNNVRVFGQIEVDKRKLEDLKRRL